MTDIINTYIQRTTNKILDKLDKKLDKELYNKYYTGTKTTLDEFRALISNNGGLQRLNRFMFNIPLPEFLRPSLIENFTLRNFMSTQGLNIFDGSLGLLCTKVSVPAKQVNTRTIKINGQTRVIPMNYRWDNITAEFIDPLNGLIYNTFYDWLDGINNPVTNTGRFYDEFVKDLRIDYMSRDSEVKNYITLVEAFPISVSRTDVDYSESGYMKTTVTFTYLYQQNKDYSSHMLYNILNNVTDGVAGGLLDVATTAVSRYNPAQILKNTLKF